MNCLCSHTNQELTWHTTVFLKVGAAILFEDFIIYDEVAGECFTVMGQDGIGGIRHDVDCVALHLDSVTSSQHCHGHHPDTYKSIELNWI